VLFFFVSHSSRATHCFLSMVVLLLFLSFGACSHSVLFNVPGLSPMAMNDDGIVTADAGVYPNSFSYYRMTTRDTWTFVGKFGAVGLSIAGEGNLTVIGGLSRLFFFDLSSPSWDEPFFSVNASCQGLHISHQTVFCGDCAHLGKCDVSIFTRELTGNNWQLSQTLVPLMPGSQRFGKTLSAVGNVLVVGDMWFGGHDEGAVYFYENNGSNWTLVASFQGTIGGEEVGCDVSVSSDQAFVLVGSHENSVREFERVEGQWQSKGALHVGGQNMFGLAVENFGQGFIALSADAVNVFTTQDAVEQLTFNSGGP
jgi:hypothetical protein